MHFPGKDTSNNPSSYMKIQDINFTALHKMESYKGPFLSRDFVEQEDTKVDTFWF